MEYLDPDGKSPFQRWYLKLDKSLKIKVDARLQRVRITSNLGNFKKLKEGVYEFKFNIPSGLRIYFGIQENQIILLLIGGNKKSQEKDIIKATKYLKDYLKRSM